MDHGSFDALTRSLSGAQPGRPTRRALSRLLGRGALVAPLVAWGWRDAATKGKHHEHKKKRRKRRRSKAPRPGPCHFDFECPGQICTSGECRGGETCAQDTDCPAPLECRPSSQECLLPSMQYGPVEPGTCDPVSPTACGPITLDGEVFATTCLLGACVLLCDNFAAASACEEANGVCVDSFCFERD